jgi:hypothetical protein
MLTGFVAEEMDTMREALDTEEWAELSNRLFEFVINFSAKVVQATGGFQM